MLMARDRVIEAICGKNPQRLEIRDDSRRAEARIARLEKDRRPVGTDEEARAPPADVNLVDFENLQEQGDTLPPPRLPADTSTPGRERKKETKTSRLAHHVPLRWQDWSSSKISGGRL